MKKQLKWIVLLIILFSANQAKAQYDPMFTNYMWNEMYINPAYTGTREAVSVVALLRNQWVGMDGAPVTQTITMHTPMLQNQAGFGICAIHETIGITRQNYVMGSFAYRFKLGHGRFSMGLSIGALSKRDFLSEVNTTEPGDLSFAVNTPLMTMPNGSFGLYYYTDKYYLGYSIPRLINNQIVADVGIIEAKNTFDYKNLHHFLTGGYVFNLSKDIKLKPTALIKMVYGAPLEVDITLNALFREIVWAGLAYRSGDAASLLIGIQINPNLRIGYSYDYTITKLQQVNTGTHEICIGYDFGISRSKIVSPRFF